MLSATIKYGGVKAKILALYGKRLREDDFEKLNGFRDLKEVIGFLKAHDYWQNATRELSINSSKEKLSLCIKEGLYSDYQKLYSFAQNSDKEYIKLLMYKCEYEIILSFFRRLIGNEDREDIISDFMAKNISLNINELRAADDYLALARACRGSVYEKIMARQIIQDVNGFPSYGELAKDLESTYYKQAFSFMGKSFKGETKEKLLRIMGAEVDILNLLNILRLKKYFSSVELSKEDILLPISYKIKPNMLDTMIKAKDEREVLELISKTPYAKDFKAYQKGDTQEISENARLSLCKKILRSPTPGIYDVVAYLTIKEQECKHLFQLFETKS